MAQDDTEQDQPLTDPSIPEEAQPDAGRALGASTRGNVVPQGEDLRSGNDVAGESDVADLSAPPMPAAPAVKPTVNPQRGPLLAPTQPELPATGRIDRAALAAQARADLEASTKAQWESDYSEGKAVPPGGYKITPSQYGASQAAAIRQAELTASQTKTAANDTRKKAMAGVEDQMRTSGQQYYINSQGSVVPIKDESGRPLYHATSWEEGEHPDTGQPTLKMRDRYGQTQYKTPQIVHNPTDLTDNQLYYRFPNGTMKPAGDMDELANSPDFKIASAAMQAKRFQKQAIYKEAIAPMEQVASQTSDNLKTAQDQVLNLKDQSQKLSDQINQLSQDPLLNQTDGGIAGTSIGASPTDASVTLQSRLAALQSQKDQLDSQATKLQESTKNTGDIGRAARQAHLNLGITKSRAKLDSYVDQEQAARAAIKQYGSTPAREAALSSIIQAQKTYGGAVNQYSAIANSEGIAPAPAPVPTVSTATGANPLNPVAPGTKRSALAAPLPLTDAQRIASTGARLPVGAPIPGIPNAFQSVQTTPQKNDPVVDPDNPDAAPAPHSKITLSQDTSGITKQIADQDTAKRFQDTYQKLAPALDLLQTGAAGAAAVSRAASQPAAPTQSATAASVVRLKKQADDIDKTLAQSTGNLDPKLVESMQQKRADIQNQTAQAMASLSPDDQRRVTEITRDPTFWDKIKGAVKSGAQAAAEGGGSVLKGAQVAAKFMPQNVGDAAALANESPSDRMDEIKQGPAYQLGDMISQQAKETYAKNPHEDEGMISQALNEAAKGAGGFAPLVASGAAAPLTIGLQSAGSEMQDFYDKAIAGGASKDAAASAAVKRALASGAVQSALFEFLPKPLQKVANKYIVDKVVGGAFKKFLANRVAGAGEGAVLGAASAVAGNAAAGRPLGEGVGESAVGLGALQALTPRGAPTDVSPQDAARADLNAKLAAGAEPAPAPETTLPTETQPFTPNGAPSTAAEAAETLAPKDVAADKAAADQRPAPIKSAEETAQIFKAHEELNRRMAAKEEAAQKLVDQIQETTGKSRGEILATRAGKDIDQWHEELNKEAAYQKNPLVVDPDRRSAELREQIKQSDADWQEHLKQTAAEAEAAAAIQDTKTNSAAHLEAMKQQVLDRHNEITARRDAIQRELDVADRLRQSPEGGAKLKADLADQEANPPPEPPLRPDLQERKTAIEDQMTENDRLRQSGAGGEKLAEDLTDQERGHSAEDARVPTEGVEDPVADRARYEAIDRRMREIIKEKGGNAMDDPEFRKISAESENLKNRNSSNPGMPPEPIEEPTNETEQPEHQPVEQRSDAGHRDGQRDDAQGDQAVLRESTQDEQPRASAAAKEEGSGPRGSETPVRAESPLADQNVKIKVKRGNGAEVEMEMPAREAEKRVNDHISVLEKIRKCLGD